MNEKGLVTSLLYLAESRYPEPAANEQRKPISISVWAQYVLDNYATVSEAVDALRQETFYVVPVMTPDGQARHGAPGDLGSERRFRDLRIHRR